MSDEDLGRCPRCNTAFVRISNAAVCVPCRYRREHRDPEDPYRLPPVEFAVWQAEYLRVFGGRRKDHEEDCDAAARIAASVAWLAVDALRKHGGRR